MRKLFAFAIVVAAACGCTSSADAPDQQWALVQNHFYIDHAPRDERDMVKQLAYITHEGQNVGVRGQSSRFRFFVDVLTWQRQGNTLRSTVLQTNKKLQTTFRAWRCQGKAPRPFELCLELKEGDRVRHYFSRNDWIIESAADASALAARVDIDPSASAGD